MLFRRRRHLLDGVLRRKTVEITGVHQAARTIVGLAERVGDECAAGRLDDDRDREVVLARELEVALIVSRHAHHGARAVLAEDEVRDPDRYRPLRERIDCRPARVEPFLLDLPRHPRRAVLRLESFERLRETRPCSASLLHCLDERMLGREQQEVRAVNRVDAGGEDLDRVGLAACGSRLAASGSCSSLQTLRRQRCAAHAAADREPRAASGASAKRTRAPSDRPIQFRCIVSTFSGQPGQPVGGFEQLVSVVRDAEEPLLQLARS